MRGLPVSSPSHGLTGVCDVVEFHGDGSVVPVEYKRGRPKAHKADEIQICGQAICLEETLNLAEGDIRQGFLFYGKKQRRTSVTLNSELRQLTLAIAEKVRALKQEGHTPQAEYIPKLCDNCSLIRLCEPKSMRLKRGVAAWFRTQIATNSTSLSEP